MQMLRDMKGVERGSDCGAGGLHAGALVPVLWVENIRRFLLQLVPPRPIWGVGGSALANIGG